MFSSYGSASRFLVVAVGVVFALALGIGSAKAQDYWEPKGDVHGYPQRPGYKLMCTWMPISPCAYVKLDKPISVDSSGTNLNVNVQRPTVPKYTREGSALGKSFDDFVGKR